MLIPYVLIEAPKTLIYCMIWELKLEWPNVLLIKVRTYSCVKITSE